MNELWCVLLMAAWGPTEDWSRYPSKQACTANVAAAQKYVEELTRLKAMAPAWQRDIVWDRHTEAVHRLQVWEHLADMSRYENYRTWEEIDKLRGMVGDRVFYSGEWPGPLPAHHFEVQR